MAAGHKTGGRKAGTPNKLGATAKENIQAVFVRLGGYKHMTEWARENPTEFYRLYSKLLPVEAHVSGKDGGPISVILSSTDQLVL